MRLQWELTCDHYSGEASIFLSTFLKVGPWGTMNQITRKFPLLRPLMWVMIPPSIVLTMPTLLRLNHKEVKARIDRRHALDHPDYMQSLIPEQDGDLPKDDWIFAQADQMMAASFDPLTNVLTASVFYLGTNPEKMARTITEIRGSFVKYEDITAEGLQNCKYLTAVIDECMRVHTNAAFGLPRVSPGATVDGRYVPRGVRNYLAGVLPAYLIFAWAS